MVLLGSFAPCKVILDSLIWENPESRPRAFGIGGRFPFRKFRLVKSNETDHFGLVRPVYSGPALKLVHSDRSGHFGRSDRNVPFHLAKLLSPVPLFCIMLTRTITKRTMA